MSKPIHMAGLKTELISNKILSLMKKLFLFSLFLTWLGIMGASAQAPVAYAVLSGDGKTLTFYYDSERASRPGTTFSLNTDAMSMPEWYANRTTVNTVVFDPSFASARPTITSQWFYDMYRLTSINGMENLNTSEVTDMGNMFGNCSSLTSLDVSGFNTDNVTNMAGMFVGCWKLESLDVSHFNTAKVTDMTNMFVGCQSLKSLDVSNFNTAKVIDMNDMFDYCKSLESLDLSSFTFNGNMDTDRMMTQCTSLKSLTIPSTAGNLSSDACDGVGTETEPCTLICPEGFTPEDATQGSGYIIWKSGYFTVAYKEAYTVLSEDGKTLTFYYDIERASRPGTTFSLNTDATSMPEWYANRTTVETVVFDPSFASAEPTTTFYWFYGMSKLTSINGIENLNTSEVINMGRMFESCSSLTSLDVSGFKTDNVTNMGSMFAGCSSLESLDVSGFKTDNVTNMGSMFAGCSSLESLDLSGFKTDNVTYMGSMFERCKSLTSLDVSGFKTDNVTNMGYMFDDCSGLKSLDVSGFKTDNVTNMGSMFAGCSGLESLDVSGFKTDNVTNMASMFERCKSLTSLDVSGFKTDKVRYFGSMFYLCSSLKNLDVSGFKTDKAVTTSFMFNGCSGLTSLDLSSFTFNGNMDTGNMLRQCTSLKSLTIPSTAGNLSSNACFGVGTETEPCTLICHEGFTPEGATQGSGYIIWKSGYFTVAYREVLVRISKSTYATLYYQDLNLKVPASVTAYYVRKEGKNITLTAVGDIIPAGAPVVLHAPNVENDGTDYKFIVTDETATAPTENDLVGSEEGGTYNDAGFKYYILSWKNADMKVEEVGFYFQSGSKGAYATVAAHQAYLKVPASQANEFGYMFEDTDAIDTVATGVLTDADAVYTLSGMRVKADNLKRGIYIVNGKKVVIK